MRVMVLGEDAIRRLLPMADCIEAMERAFRAAAAGDYVQPLRIIAWQPDQRGAIAAMPAYLDGFLGAKLITVFPHNRAEGLTRTRVLPRSTKRRTAVCWRLRCRHDYGDPYASGKRVSNQTARARRRGRSCIAWLRRASG